MRIEILENLFEDEILKKNKFGNGNFGNFILRMEYWKLNLEIGILENLFEDGILKIKFENLNFWKIYLMMAFF